MLDKLDRVLNFIIFELIAPSVFLVLKLSFLVTAVGLVTMAITSARNVWSDLLDMKAAWLEGHAQKKEDNDPVVVVIDEANPQVTKEFE